MTTTNRRLFVADLLSAGVLLAATGCASASGSVAAIPASPTASGSPVQHTLPAGFHRISNAAKTISLGVPSQWAVIDLAGNPDADLQKAGVTDPAIRSQVIEQLKAAGAVFVIDATSRRSSPAGFLTNLIAFCSPVPATSVEALKAETRQELQQAGATNIQTSDTTLDGRPAIRTTFGGALNGAETATLINGQKCAVTLSTDRLNNYQRTFDQITATTDLR
jgi:hypothetical protein